MVASGELLWKFRVKKQIFSTPCIADNVIYVGCMDGVYMQ